MKTIMLVAWALFSILIGGYLGEISGKVYNKYGWFIAIATLITLELCWYVMYFIGAWVISIYIP